MRFFSFYQVIAGLKNQSEQAVLIKFHFGMR